jgi:hypothetical protein
MLHGSVWRRIAKETEMLCAACCFVRARQRRIRITLGRLLPVPFNLLWPWFDLLAARESAPPPNINEWRKQAASPATQAYRKEPLHDWLKPTERARA